VKTKDATSKLCAEYKGLNKLIIKNKFPSPIIDDLFDHVHGAIIFSKINIRNGYHHIHVKDQDVPKTCFKIGFGHYKFMVMPFGLTNTLATHMTLMNFALKKYLRFVLVFMNDILVYSKSKITHLVSK
jgi:hypothetical protein